MAAFQFEVPRVSAEDPLMYRFWPTLKRAITGNHEECLNKALWVITQNFFKNWDSTYEHFCKCRVCTHTVGRGLLPCRRALGPISKTNKIILTFFYSYNRRNYQLLRWTYQLSHVGRRGLRTWTSLGLEALRNFTSVIVVNFQNGRNVSIGHDRFGCIGRLASRSPTGGL
jgi:hypothetical protein